MSLLNNLVSYWKLDEPSGNAIDSHGSNTLTANGSPGTAAGVIGTSRSFNGSNQWCHSESNASLQTGNIDFTIQAWVYLLDTSSQGIVTKDTNTPSGSRDYTLDYNSFTRNFRFYVNGGSNSNEVFVPGAALVNTWVHLLAWHNSANNTLNISLNNETPVSSNIGSTLIDVSNAQFQIGARQFASSLIRLNGRIDEVGFWKRVLTTEERSRLYNSGSGLPYPFSVNSQRRRTQQQIIHGAF